MTTPTVFMFSGHGSHYFHMGRDLFEQQSDFRRHLLDLDAVARDVANVSVVEVLYDSRRTKSDTFDQTRFSHPAIFMIEYALARTLIDHGVYPDLVLGVSAGTLAAITIAGCIDPADALRAAIKQAEAFELFCPSGGMLAVAEDGERLARDKRFCERSEIAAYNFEASAVISAPAEVLVDVEACLRQDNALYQKLAVSRAFHSRWIDGAKDVCDQIVLDIGIRRQHIPFVCCASSATLHAFTHEDMWRVMREPIRFKQTVSMLDRQGHFRYIDVGPSGTLATLLKYSLPKGSSADIVPIMSPFSHDMRNLLRIIQ
jgi:acyl transferase domain-containing protein